MNLVFPGAGHFITTHRGWGIWSLASISCYESLLFQSWRRQALMHSKRKIFVADWLKSTGLYKLCSVFEDIQEPFILSKPCLHTQLLEHNRTYWKFPGVGAFDHLEWTYDGAFEQLFGLGRGEFEPKFSKNSNARGVARGGDVLASILTGTLRHVSSRESVGGLDVKNTLWEDD